jgi:hypothetical protein
MKTSKTRLTANGPGGAWTLSGRGDRGRQPFRGEGPQVPNRTAVYLLLMCFSAVAPCGNAQSDATPDDVKVLAAQYVAAFNAKDVARLHALYHPKSLACITPDSRSFYDEELAIAWRDPIPANYTINMSALNENNLKAIEQFGAFPARPDQELQINYQQGEDGGIKLIYLVRDNGRLYDDYPCATEKILKQYRDDAPARAQRAVRYRTLAAEIREPLRSQLIVLLREHKTASADTRYKEASGQDYGTSIHVVDVLAHEGRP